VRGACIGDVCVEKHTAGREDHQTVTGLLDVGDDVRRQERRPSAMSDGVDEDSQEVAAGERVEAGQRLVEEKDRRLRPEG
jgi:hypothetical protein